MENENVGEFKWFALNSCSDRFFCYELANIHNEYEFSLSIGENLFFISTGYSVSMFCDVIMIFYYEWILDACFWISKSNIPTVLWDAHKFFCKLQEK